MIDMWATNRKGNTHPQWHQPVGFYSGWRKEGKKKESYLFCSFGGNSIFAIAFGLWSPFSSSFQHRLQISNADSGFLNRDLTWWLYKWAPSLWPLDCYWIPLIVLNSFVSPLVESHWDSSSSNAVSLPTKYLIQLYIYFMFILFLQWTLIN